MSSINYDLSKIKAFVFDVDGVLSPSTIPLDPVSGQPVRMVNIKDGYAMQLAIKHGYHIAIITGADSESLKVRYGNLGINDVYTKASVKLPIFNRWMELKGLHEEQVAYVGDDIPDYEVMQHAGLSVAPADAAPEIKEMATFITKSLGGHGVAREIIEEVMRAQGEWMSSGKAFGW